MFYGVYHLLVTSLATDSEETRRQRKKTQQEGKGEKHLCEREVGPKEPSWRCHSGFCPGELARDSSGQAAKK